MSSLVMHRPETKTPGDVEEVMARVRAKNPAEPELHQDVQEAFDSLRLALEKHPEFQDARILERLVAGARSSISRAVAR